MKRFVVHMQHLDALSEVFFQLLELSTAAQLNKRRSQKLIDSRFQVLSRLVRQSHVASWLVMSWPCDELTLWRVPHLPILHFLVPHFQCFHPVIECSSKSQWQSTIKKYTLESFSENTGISNVVKVGRKSVPGGQTAAEENNVLPNMVLVLRRT